MRWLRESLFELREQINAPFSSLRGEGWRCALSALLLILMPLLLLLMWLFLAVVSIFRGD